MLLLKAQTCMLMVEPCLKKLSAIDPWSTRTLTKLLHQDIHIIVIVVIISRNICRTLYNFIIIILKLPHETESRLTLGHPRAIKKKLLKKWHGHCHPCCRHHPAAATLQHEKKEFWNHAIAAISHCWGTSGTRPQTQPRHKSQMRRDLILELRPHLFDDMTIQI